MSSTTIIVVMEHDQLKSSFKPIAVARTKKTAEEAIDGAFKRHVADYVSLSGLVDASQLTASELDGLEERFLYSQKPLPLEDAQ